MGLFYLFIILIVCIPVIIRNFDIVKYYSFGKSNIKELDKNDVIIYSEFVNSIKDMSDKKHCVILYWDRPMLRQRFIYSNNKNNFYVSIKDFDFNEKNDNKLYGYLNLFYPKKDDIWCFCNKTLIK